MLRPNHGESQKSLDRLPIVGFAVELDFLSAIGKPYVEQELANCKLPPVRIVDASFIVDPAVERGR